MRPDIWRGGSCALLGIRAGAISATPPASEGLTRCGRGGGSPFDRSQHPPEMTAKPGSRQAPRQSHSLAPRRALRIAQAARARRLARNARSPHRPDARHSVRCLIDVSAAPFQSRRHIAGRGRRTWLEHEHRERPQLPHELRKAHTKKAEQGARCASRLHARRLPARSPAPDGSDAVPHGVDCLSERPNSHEGTAKQAHPLNAAVSASFHAPAHGPRHVRHLLPELATGNPHDPGPCPAPAFHRPESPPPPSSPRTSTSRSACCSCCSRLPACCCPLAPALALHLASP
jgi:hypothetical protein